MNNQKKVIALSGLIVLILLTAFVVMAFAFGASPASAANFVRQAVNLDDDEQPITGEALEKASAAALEYTGGGRVTDSEVGDEEGYYEIEVTLDDGSQVDVHLDENFNVLGQESDAGEVDGD